MISRKQIDKLLAENFDITEYNEDYLEEEFDSLIDSIYPVTVIFNLTFFPSNILRTDKVAYRESFLNWLDGREDLVEADDGSYWDSEEYEKAIEDREPERVLVIDDSQGIYIPQKFAVNFTIEDWHVSPEDAEILKAGPDHTNYWETWEDVLKTAYYIEKADDSRWQLEQDDSLFIYKAEGK